MWQYVSSIFHRPSEPHPKTRSAAEFLGQVKRPRPKSPPKKNKRRKAYINKRLKKSVWVQYMGRNFEGPCYACNRKIIDVFDCHYGHVIAEHKGGALNVQNLRPICALCNQASSVRHMREFAMSNGFYDAAIVQEAQYQSYASKRPRLCSSSSKIS
uniref:HNH domain-containing protein n=1 Tax=viral metagenome TaxID=1070528 RepID=A0A6C0BQ80_9ZZZZ